MKWTTSPKFFGLAYIMNSLEQFLLSIMVFLTVDGVSPVDSWNLMDHSGAILYLAYHGS